MIAGPNGAGKTTIADRWFASRIPVVSPDSIAAAQGVSAVEAGKLAVSEQERLLAANASFAIDTTLSGQRELRLMQGAKVAGFKVNLVFVGAPDPDLCIARSHSGWRMAATGCRPRTCADATPEAWRTSPPLSPWPIARSPWTTPNCDHVCCSLGRMGGCANSPRVCRTGPSLLSRSPCSRALPARLLEARRARQNGR